MNVASIPTIADYRAREQVFFDNLENLETIYRRIKKNDSQPLNFAMFDTDGGDITFTESLALANANWTDKGLKLTAEQLAGANLGFSGLQFGYSFRLAGDFKSRITALPDADAAEVAFTPGAKDIYFLVPSLYFIFALNSTGNTNQYLNYFYGQLPRPAAVDSLNEFYSTNVFGPREWYQMHANPAKTTLAAYNASLKSAKVARSLPGARLFEVTGSGSIYAWTTGNPAIDFDNPTHSSLYPVYPDGTYAHSNFNRLAQLDDERTLQAIIKQGENYFFVWKKKDADFE